MVQVLGYFFHFSSLYPAPDIELYTLGCKMFAQGKKQLETREIIKIQNFKLADSKKLRFSKLPILKIFWNNLCNENVLT